MKLSVIIPVYNQEELVIRAVEDYYFYQELIKKNPTEKFTNKVIKHYNYPRKGSLSYLHKKGEI